MVKKKILCLKCSVEAIEATVLNTALLFAITFSFDGIGMGTCSSCKRRNEILYLLKCEKRRK